MAIKPVGHRVLVRPETIEEHDDVYKAARKVGIEIVEQSRRKQETAIDRGIVLAIGDTACKDFGGDPWCQVGDVIAYARFGGKFIKDPDDEEENKYLILNDDDIIAVVTTGKTQ